MMRELIISFILVSIFSITLNTPPPQPVQAESNQTIVEAPQKPKEKKVAKNTNAKKNKPTEPRKQAVAVPRVVNPTNTSSGGCEQYRILVSKYFPAHEVSNALLTMSKESGCRSDAVSPTNDHGLMQINCTYHCAKVGGDVSRLYDPETNVRLASEIFAGRGWNAWYAVRGILW